MSDDTTPAANLKVYLNYSSIAGSGTIAGPLTGATSQAWAVPLIAATDVAVNATVIDASGLKGYSQVLVPKIASPLTASHAPKPSSRSSCRSEIVPSAIGPTFSSRLPFLLTMSTNKRISSSTAR